MLIPDLSLDHVEGCCEELIDAICVLPVAHVMRRCCLALNNCQVTGVRP